MQVLNFGDEKNKVIVIDDILEAPDELVEYAKGVNFLPWPEAIERKGYPGVRAQASPIHMKLVRDRLDPIMRDQFDVSADAGIKVYQETLNLITVPEHDLGPLQRVPHFDTSTPNFFAILLYLCDESHGGTGFYRHNSTGYELITPERSERYLDYCFLEINSKRREKKYFSGSDEFYTEIGFVPARFNRVVIYRGGVIHSANIVDEKSINLDPVGGRLTANMFVGY